MSANCDDSLTSSNSLKGSPLKVAEAMFNDPRHSVPLKNVGKKLTKIDSVQLPIAFDDLLFEPKEKMVIFFIIIILFLEKN